MYKDRESTPESAPKQVEEEPEYLEVDDSCAEGVGIGKQKAADPETSTVSLRRSERISHPPERYMLSLHYLLLTDAGEPSYFEEALEIDKSGQWELAMNDEMESLMKNQTWDLVELPEGKKALQNKWVYRIKEEHDGTERFKARLVVKGFQQKPGIDFDEIFSPVVKMTTVRLVLGMVAVEDLHLEQLDVKTAFLHGELEEELYMVQPQGYTASGKEQLVCRLKKSLYGLKQAPRQWYRKFDSFMHENGYKRCNADHCCFRKVFSDSFIILLLYVDDMLLAGSDMKEISELKGQLSKEFEMKDLGAAKKILGMKIVRNRADKRLELSQQEYVERVLHRFNMGEAKPVGAPLGSHFKLSKEQAPKTEEQKAQMERTPYASAIGSLMYAMICTRPDIAHAVGVVSRFMSNPGKQHWEAVKWILRYLKGTASKVLCYGGIGQGYSSAPEGGRYRLRSDETSGNDLKEITLQGFVDADLAGDVDSRRSTTGYVFTYGGAAICWASKLQKIVALSTTEAEYVAVTEASKEVVWLQGFMEELGKGQERSRLYSDSQSAIHLARNAAFHSRTKHIQLRYHFIRSLLDEGTLLLEKIHTAENPADMFTKVVTLEKLRLCAASVGLQD